MCFNVDDRMLPCFLGADLSSRRDMLRVLHKELLASSAEHTAAHHERFAKPVPCKDKTKWLLEMRQWLADLRDVPRSVHPRGGGLEGEEGEEGALRTARSPPSKEGQHQRSQKRSLAPKEPEKLHSAIEQKAAGWAVMDADTTLSDASAAMLKGAKSESKRCRQCVSTVQTVCQGERVREATNRES